MLSTIRKGNTGDLVKVAQYMLNYCERKQATGIFDEDFANAVNIFQGSNNLTADSIIGPATWTKLASKMPTCSTSKNKTSVYTCAIQIILGGLTVDGIYGTNTKNAVTAFQSASGLTADGICGPKTWNALIGVTTSNSGSSSNNGTPAGEGQEISGSKVLNNCVKYLQWDSKWKKVMFSNHNDKNQTIGNSGCGPSSMAMIMATFIDSTITPVEMCKLAVDRGHRSYNSGTNWSFFKDVFSLYDGFEKFVQTKSIETLKAAIREGALAVCSMNSNEGNFWTTGGCDNLMAS